MGHPNGLSSGADPEALKDLLLHINVAAELGATVMRICAGGRNTRLQDWNQHRRLLIPRWRVPPNMPQPQASHWLSKIMPIYTLTKCWNY
ncbi:hypothetical protein ACFVWT_08655 [Arthrobacter sp. NPDC058288]|uniref:hypothetical protein n=1 Tax=Arthrobacter sp. NPDC058288 TaxID=3346424 RepID=UPI0036EBE4F9